WAPGPTVREFSQTRSAPRHGTHRGAFAARLLFGLRLALLAVVLAKRGLGLLDPAGRLGLSEQVQRATAVALVQLLTHPNLAVASGVVADAEQVHEGLRLVLRETGLGREFLEVELVMLQLRDLEDAHRVLGALLAGPDDTDARGLLGLDNAQVV